MAKHVIGVDLGGTTVKIGLFDNKGNLYKCSEIVTRLENSGEYILDDICAEIKNILKDKEISLSSVSGVGIGVPGPVIDGRKVLRCVNLGWNEKNIALYMEDKLGLECKIGNDANVAALGESWKGASKDTHSSIMLTIGTGIGGGIIIENKIVSGFNGAAGEIGHIPIHEAVEGRICGCGNINCLEIFASANGTSKNYLQSTNNIASCKDIFEATRKGEQEAVSAVSNMQELIGKACAFLGCIINPEIFVIGGGVSKAGDHLIRGIRENYKKYVFPAVRDTKIVLANLGNDAGMYGAAKLIIN